MLRLVSVLCVCLTLTQASVASITLYVDDDAPHEGDGLTWETAYRHLQDALDAAREDASLRGGVVTEVRVARGVYAPDLGGGQTTGDVFATFWLPSGVVVRGGYGGLGTPNPDARDVGAFETVLTGYLGEQGGPRSMHVVRAEDTALGTVLDGFTVCGGDSDGSAPIDDRGAGIRVERGYVDIVACRFKENESWHRGGAVWFADAKVTIAGCVIEENESRGGGGVSVGPGSDLVLSDSVLRLNHAETEQGFGGALHLESDASIVRTIFEQNSGPDGGAIMMPAGDYELTLADCSFVGNLADVYGGAIAIEAAKLTATGCLFEANAAGDSGGAIRSFAGATMVFEVCRFVANEGADGVVRNDGKGVTVRYDRCEFVGNQCTAVYERESNFSFTSCTFRSNFTYTLAGAAIRIASGGGGGAIVDCTFAENHAKGQRGGAMQISGSVPVYVIDCDFVGNIARDGGGLSTRGGMQRIIGCRFVGNIASEEGGGCHTMLGPSQTLYLNCLFSGNRSLVGGAAAVFGGEPTFANCTIVNNEGIDDAAAIAALDGLDWTHVRMKNVLMWGNHVDGSSGEEDQVIIEGDTSIQFDFCCLEGWTGALGGVGNTGADPMLVDPLGPDGLPGTHDDDPSLGASSSCLDAGANWVVPMDDRDVDGDGVVIELYPYDFLGNPRFAGDGAPGPGCGEPVQVDIGAYEINGAITPSVLFADITGDGVVDVDDLIAMLASWGDAGAACLSDLNVDGTVGTDDLLALLVMLAG